jgi:hypothetical protein
MVSVTLFPGLDAALGGVIEYVILVLVVVNIGTRLFAHHQHKAQAEEGADAMSRSIPHELSNVALVVASLYYLTVHHHGGMVMSVLVLGLFITDFFEFESRKVEARRGIEIERPKGAIAASMLALTYAAFQSLFFVVEPIWTAIV